MMNNDDEWNDDDDDTADEVFTPIELLETVLNLAECTVNNQYDDDTRTALYAVLDACANAYGIEVHAGRTPPRDFPFKITDISPPEDE